MIEFPSSASRFARGAFALALLTILVATLAPFGGPKPALSVCLVCGERGLADGLRNIFLYAPLGAATAWCGWRRPRVLVAAIALSALIELAQVWIPGRDPSLGDVTFNAVGAIAGFWAGRSSDGWLRPAGRLRVWLMLLGAFGVLATAAATGMLLQADFPRSTYWGQWTPNLGHLEWYRGRIVGVTIGALEVADGPVPHSAAVRSLLLSRTALRIRAVAGPPVPALGSLFSIYDGQQREVVLVGPDRDDLVFRYRTRAAAARLEQPALRAEGALRGVAAGDSLGVEVRRDGNGRCLEVNARAFCGLGFTIGRAWALIGFPETFPSWLRILLDDGWLAGLLMPLGFWLTGRRTGPLVVLAVAAGLVLVPVATGLMPTPPGGLAGAAVGLALGLGLRRRLARPPRAA